MMKIKLGFTLIEVLVSISIIAVLFSLALVSYGGSQKQSRDTQIRSDLNQYRSAMENFAAANNGKFVSRNNRTRMDTNVCTPDLLPGGFISSCPNTHNTLAYYQYRSNGGGSGAYNATKYVIWATLENGTCWEVCSDGRVGITVCPDDVNNLDQYGNCSVQ